MNNKIIAAWIGIFLIILVSCILMEAYQNNITARFIIGIAAMIFIFFPYRNILKEIEKNALEMEDGKNE